MTTACDAVIAGFTQIKDVQIPPDPLTHIWSTGCKDDANAVLGVLPRGAGAKAYRFDCIVGNPGPASGWIALAAALEVSQGAGLQLVLWREPESEPLQLCMVMPAPLSHKETTV
jgi:hypothetical protein